MRFKMGTVRVSTGDIAERIPRGLAVEELDKPGPEQVSCPPSSEDAKYGVDMLYAADIFIDKWCRSGNRIHVFVFGCAGAERALG